MSVAIARRIEVIGWSAAITTYAIYVVMRWIVAAQAPGLASAAGLCGLLSVGLYVRLQRLYKSATATEQSRVRTRNGLLLVLGAAIVSSVANAWRQLGKGEPVPVLPLVATFCFSLVFRHVLLLAANAPATRLPSTSTRDWHDEQQ